MSYVEVRLTWSEFQEAAIVGASRVTSVVFRDLKCPAGTETETKWQQHIEGAIAERVVAKHLNQYWPGLGAFNSQADVGSDVEVKSSPKHSNNLLVPVHHVREGAKYYLVTGEYNDRRVHGWMLGERVAEYPVVNHKGRGNAHLVPKEDLNSCA